ncbi:ABC-type sugar transport system permease subunit [Chryseomicrobium aureum]|uniref:carbohydrate ABC transporter permease n=1 Tax=Chryseomicrobium aureum TaxID=1441723 RepID=UPI00195B18BC|nr:sugar ABC transporter permease [Chryseomicrobium aureum]MBM7707097.1 ABC-type sugar transport system permease subunit [Chryseomicrobium aureum]
MRAEILKQPTESLVGEKVKTKKKFNKWPYIFLLPSLILYGIFYVFPFFYSFVLSFMEWNLISPDKEYVGFDNYNSIWSDSVFWKSLLNTLIYVVATVPLSMMIGLSFALLVESVSGKMRETYRMLLFIPVIASIAVTSLVWQLLMNPEQGWINDVLNLFGLPQLNWLNDPNVALWAIVIIGIWKAVGYNMILYIAGLKGIDKQLYEAASIDGAGKWRQTISITIPMLSPINIFVFIVSVIQSFQVFTTIHLMTQGGPNNSTNMLVYQIYEEAFMFFDIGKASALSAILFIIVLIITIFQIRTMEKKVHYQ